MIKKSEMFVNGRIMNYQKNRRYFTQIWFSIIIYDFAFLANFDLY